MFPSRTIREEDVVFIGMAHLVDGESGGGGVDMEPRSWHQTPKPKTRVCGDTKFGPFFKVNRTPKDTILERNVVIYRLSLVVNRVIRRVGIALALVDDMKFGFIF